MFRCGDHRRRCGFTGCWVDGDGAPRDLSTHGIIRELEAAYAEYTGRRFALAHTNGTAALMAALHGLGLQPGDLVPTATFWASVLPMLWFGLVPIFCNSEPARLGIDPEHMRARIGPKTKAAVVHLWGFPSKMTEIRQVADECGLKIVEDASHAHVARWRGTPCGNLGDVSVFSLQGDKLAPAGEGGVLLPRRRAPGSARKEQQPGLPGLPTALPAPPRTALHRRGALSRHRSFPPGGG